MIRVNRARLPEPHGTNPGVYVVQVRVSRARVHRPHLPRDRANPTVIGLTISSTHRKNVDGCRHLPIWKRVRRLARMFFLRCARSSTSLLVCASKADRARCSTLNRRAAILRFRSVSCVSRASRRRVDPTQVGLLHF